MSCEISGFPANFNPGQRFNEFQLMNISIFIHTTFTDDIT